MKTFVKGVKIELNFAETIIDYDLISTNVPNCGVEFTQTFFKALLARLQLLAVSN